MKFQEAREKLEKALGRSYADLEWVLNRSFQKRLKPLGGKHGITLTYLVYLNKRETMYWVFTQEQMNFKWAHPIFRNNLKTLYQEKINPLKAVQHELMVQKATFIGHKKMCNLTGEPRLFLNKRARRSINSQYRKEMKRAAAEGRVKFNGISFYFLEEHWPKYLHVIQDSKLKKIIQDYLGV
jgi:hypothetical protein